DDRSTAHGPLIVELPAEVRLNVDRLDRCLQRGEAARERVRPLRRETVWDVDADAVRRARILRLVVQEKVRNELRRRIRLEHTARTVLREVALDRDDRAAEQELPAG